MKRFNVVLAGTVLVSGLALGGYALNNGSALANEKKEEAQPGIMFDEAEAIALEETGGGIVQQLERDQDDGVELYEVEIEKEGHEYELDIAADSGKVIRAENERSDDDDDERTNLPKGTISSDKAIEIALKEVKGTVTEVELDEDDGQYVYEIEVKTNKDGETKIDVNALDGKILKVEIDD